MGELILVLIVVFIAGIGFVSGYEYRKTIGGAMTGRGLLALFGVIVLSIGVFWAVVAFLNLVCGVRVF